MIHTPVLTTGMYHISYNSHIKYYQMCRTVVNVTHSTTPQMKLLK
eukprot:UN25674